MVLQTGPTTALFLPSFDSTIIRNKIRPHSLVVSTFHRPSHFAADTAAVFAASFSGRAQLLNASHPVEVINLRLTLGVIFLMRGEIDLH